MLRRYFNVPAKEALTELPSWEVDLMLDGLRAERKAAEQRQMGQRPK